MASRRAGNDKVLGRRLHLLALEPRMMFDGAAVAVAQTVIDAAMAPAGQDMQAAGHDRTAAPDSEPNTPVTHDAAPVSAPPLTTDVPRSEIAFVSNNLANWRELADAFASSVQVVILDGTRDGVEQMSQALAGRTGIDAIHLLTHGVAGQIELGTATLNESSMQGQYRDALSRMGASLADRGDILVYGCNFSAGASGLSAARTLSSLTGADVAASNDFTGAARFGGDWDLETQIGVVETQVGISAAERVSYDKLMAQPIAVPDKAATEVNTPVTIIPLNNDRDPDHDALSIISAQASNGTVVINAGQTLTYTPNAGYQGVDQITYAISDGGGGVGRSVVDISVSAADTPPTNFVPISQTVQEDTQLVFSAANGNALSVSDPDSNIQIITLSVTKGYFTLSGTAGLTFTVGDGTADTTMTFKGTVAAINAALEGSSFQGAADANGAAQLTFQTVTNPAPSPSWINGGFEQPHTGSIQGIFNEDLIPGWETDASSNNIEILGNGYAGVIAHEGNQFAQINAFSVAPLFQLLSPSQGSLVSISFSHRGRDGTDVMSVVATDLGADGIMGTSDDTVLLNEQFADSNTQWGTYNRVLTNQASGNIIRFELHAVSSATGDLRFGNFIDGIFALESKGDIDTVQIDIASVNDAPAGTDKSISLNEDGSHTFSATDFGFTDPNDTPTNGFAAVVITTLPSSSDGKLTLNSIAVTAGQVIAVTDLGGLVFTPVANRSGTGLGSFNFQVQDDGGVTNGGVDTDQSANTFAFNIASTPPVAVSDTAATEMNTSVTITALNNDSDPDGEELSITSASALHGTVVINAGQTLTYTPNAGYLGLDQITYAISDGHGGVASSVVDISVNAPDIAPTNTAPLNQTVLEDTPWVFSAANGNALSVSDPDSNVQTVTLSVTKGFFTLSGTAGLTFTVGDGTADTTMTFNGTVAAINAALEGSFFQGMADANGAAQLTFQTVTNPAPSPSWINGGFEAPDIFPSGTAVPNKDLVPGWDTDANHRLIEIWRTGHNGVVAYEGNQFAEINEIENAALFQNFSPSQGSLVAITFSHRGRNGVDVMRVNAIDLGADGIVGTADDTILFSEQFADDNTQWGSYSRVLTTQATGNLIRFEFRAVSTSTGDPTEGNFVDGIFPLEGKGDIDTVQINIVPVADIVNDQVRTSEDTPITFNVITGANEVSGVDNFENADRTLTEINGVAFVAGVPITISGGVIHVQSDGSVAFTPNANYHGSTSFTYTISSGGATETATVSILIDQVNDAPAGTDKTISLNEDGSYTFTAADFGFTDLNETPANGFSKLVVTTLPSPSDGKLTLNGVDVTVGQSISVDSLNQLVFTPFANHNGTVAFTFQVQDDGGVANGGLDTDPTANSITFNIASVNDAPAGTDKSISLNEDGSHTFSATDFGFTDLNDTPANAFSKLIITTLPSASDGKLTLNGVDVIVGQNISVGSLNQLVFTSFANHNGTATFTFQVQDDGGVGNGGIDTDPTANTITFNIASVNDAPSGTDKTISLNEDGSYTFSANDFGFTDPNDIPANGFAAVVITTLPSSSDGTLTLNGIAVTTGQVIAVTDLGGLVFTPLANRNGTGVGAFTFHVRDDGGVANGGLDTDPTANTITFNIASVNDAPAGTNKTISLNEDGTHTFSANDFGFTDPNDTPANGFAAVVITTLPSSSDGTLTLNGIAVTTGQVIAVTDLGGLVFTPLANRNGSGVGAFTFQVRDNGGVTNGGVDTDPTANTITFDIASVNDAPAGTDK
ncbi:Ig-like domain-containing protein, partial [Pseudomonas koreensis]|uniref:Ig-like domain-containing protein n=1 Tax=Pseudomonas koreensis TaxID=198620 RepID=UPI001B328283